MISKKTSNNRLSNAKNFLFFSEGKGHSVDSLVPLKALTQKETEKGCLHMTQSTKFQHKQKTFLADYNKKPEKSNKRIYSMLSLYKVVTKIKIGKMERDTWRIHKIKVHQIIYTKLLEL